MGTSTQTNIEVSQLYVALFGRAPDSGGLAYWAALRESGQSVAQLADAMFATEPARAYFPDGLAAQEIIGSFYLNVLGRVADPEGLLFWTGKLETAGATPGSVIAEMIDVIASYSGSDPAGIASAALYNNRATVAQYYSEHNGSIANATNVLAGVSADAQTIVAARVMELDADAHGTLDVGGFTQLRMGGVGGDVVLSNADTDATVTFTASPRPGVYEDFWTITYLRADASGASDSAAFSFAPAQNSLHIGHIVAPGIENLTVYLDPVGSANVMSTVTLIAPEAEAIEVLGDGMLLMTSDKANTSLRHVDLSEAHGVSLWLEANSVPVTIEGSPVFDVLPGTSFGDRISAGPGGDTITSGTGPDVLTGGPGADTFFWMQPTFNESGFIYPTITDFSPSAMPWQGDTVALSGFVKDHLTPLLFKEVLSLPLGATYQDYLNTAVTHNVVGQDYAPVHWFLWKGDTFLVIDNSNSGLFQDGVDQVIRFIGVVDLGGAVNLSNGILM